MNDAVQPWHYGLVARHWVEKNTTADATINHNVIVYFARK
jgi:hypothetical protein